MEDSRRLRVPEGARMLGVDLLAYALNIDEGRAKDLSEGNVLASPSEMPAILILEKVGQELKRSRMALQNFIQMDARNLAYIRLDSGQNPINTAREIQHGCAPAGDWKEPIDLALAAICTDAYPLLLTPTTRDDQFGLRLFWTFINKGHLDRAFRDSIQQDKVLSDFFETPTADTAKDMNGDARSERYTTTFGTSSSIQLGLLPDTLMNAGLIMMLSLGRFGLADFIEQTLAAKNLLRQALQGLEVYVPRITIFGGVGIPESIELDGGLGHLRPVPIQMLNRLPRDIKISDSGDGYSYGCMLVRSVPYRIIRGDLEFSERRKLLDEIPKYSELENRFELVSAFSFSDTKHVASKYSATIDVDIVDGMGVRYVHYEFEPNWKKIATREELDSINYWAGKIRGVPNEKITLAESRLISAISHRANPVDALVDAVIGLENLFGGRTEIALSVASAVARLLETDPVQRERVFKDVKTLYNARSDIVHGNARKRGANSDDLSRRAIYYLTESLKALYNSHQSLIAMDGANRCKSLLLGSN